MEKTNKILLNKTRTYNSVNVNSQIQIDIENTSKTIPLNDIDTNVSQFEQFEKERKESTIYRFYGQVTPIISNPLFNDNVKISENETIGQPPVSKKIFSSDIFETDGWIGFYNDELDETALEFNDNKSALCEFIPFDPGYDRLRILDSDGIPNYLFKITYPFRSKDISLIRNSSKTLKDGIPVIEKFVIDLNGRKYVGFKTAINHGLSTNDEISLLDFFDNTGPSQTLSLSQKTYRVFKLGNQTNDLKFRTFIIDVDPNDIDITGDSTIKRIVQNKPSSYYVREFSGLTTSSIGDKGGAYYKDYDIYPAAFGTSYYNDKVASFNFKKDVDVRGLTDNLGRPLSELYFTIIKNDSDTDPTSINSRYWNLAISGLSPTITTNPGGSTRFWTRITAGYETENNENINYNIRAFGDPSYVGNDWYKNIDESDEVFDGDIVEYNENELIEKRLELVHHRVNTLYREHLNTINSSYEDKKEGYLYKPFKKIQIREFANYINPIVDIQSLIDQYSITSQTEIENLKKSFGVPDYATVIAPNVYKWRGLLEIGEVDTTGGGVDYPFESGAHYININNRFFFQRQDPPCEYVIVTEEVSLGASAPTPPAGDKEDFLSYLSDPTFLNYSFRDVADASYIATTGGVGDISSYYGTPNITLDVNLADFVGEYDLGKRDIAGGCVNLSLLKQKDIDDVC
jgi:hypothetical protein